METISQSIGDADNMSSTSVLPTAIGGVAEESLTSISDMFEDGNLLDSVISATSTEIVVKEDQAYIPSTVDDGNQIHSEVSVTSSETMIEVTEASSSVGEEEIDRHHETTPVRTVTVVELMTNSDAVSITHKPFDSTTNKDFYTSDSNWTGPETTKSGSRSNIHTSTQGRSPRIYFSTDENTSSSQVDITEGRKSKVSTKTTRQTTGSEITPTAEEDLKLVSQTTSETTSSKPNQITSISNISVTTTESDIKKDGHGLVPDTPHTTTKHPSDDTTAMIMPGGENGNKAVIIGVSVSIFLFLLILAILAIVITRKRRSRKMGRVQNNSRMQTEDLPLYLSKPSQGNAAIRIDLAYQDDGEDSDDFLQPFDFDPDDLRMKHSPHRMTIPHLGSFKDDPFAATSKNNQISSADVGEGHYKTPALLHKNLNDSLDDNSLASTYTKTTEIEEECHYKVPKPITVK